MGTFTKQDRIFATVKYCGRILLDTSFTGVDSFQMIVRLITESLNGFAGFVTLRLRNGSQGWAREQGLRIRQSVVSSQPDYMAEAIQLSLF